MKKRIDSIDLLKTIAILMVVALHTPLFSFDFIKGNSFNLVQYFLRLFFEGVPIFMLVNGFLLFRKDELNIKKHINKIVKLIVLFVIWGLLSILYGMKVDGIIEYTNIKEIIIELFSTSKYSAYTSHLWFVQSLIVVYFIYPIVFVCFKENKKVFYFFFAIISFFTLGIDCLQLIREFIDSYSIDCRMIDNIIWGLSSIRILEDSWCLFYFMLGGIVFDKYDSIIKNKNKYIALGLIGLIFGCLFSYFVSINEGHIFDYTANFGSIFMTAFIVGLFCLCNNYEDKGLLANKAITLVSQNTFGIYFINKFVISVVRGHITTIPFVVWVLSFIISFALSILIKKIPIINKIITL